MKAKLITKRTKGEKIIKDMCFIQLTLWDVPAEVIVGNTLTMEYREYWYTFAYKRCGWHWRLEQHYQKPENYKVSVFKCFETNRCLN